MWISKFKKNKNIVKNLLGHLSNVKEIAMVARTHVHLREGETKNIVKESDLRPGDHICILRDKDLFTYMHHAIVVRINPLVVAHPAGAISDKLEKTTIIYQKTSIKEFYNNCSEQIIEKVEYGVDMQKVRNSRPGTKSYLPKLGVQQILQKVEEELSESTMYNLITNNCEGIAHKCMTGIDTGSSQVREIINSLTSLR